ncbi:MAG: DUF554 domain-containing protein [Clostridiales bacterium]|nr:DUF554 domain-containing protein [Candidatus Crickella merdequi]
MIANIGNIAVVLIVAFIGSKLNKAIRDEVTDGILKALGLYIIYLGITNLSKDTNAIALLIAVAVGAVIGTAMDWDGAMNRAANAVQKKLTKDGSTDLAGPAITYFIASCSGAYPILACFNAANGDPGMLWTKVVIDLFVGLVWATSMGIGLGLSALPMFVYQTALILLAGVLSPLLTDAMFDIIGCTGGLLTIGVGLNMSGISNFKIANYIPALLIAPFVVLAF